MESEKIYVNQDGMRPADIMAMLNNRDEGGFGDNGLLWLFLLLLNRGGLVTQFGLFEYDENGFFFSQSLVNRMQKWIDKKEKLSIAGKISAQKRLKSSTNVQQMLNKCSTNVEHMFNYNRREYNRTE